MAPGTSSSIQTILVPQLDSYIFTQLQVLNHLTPYQVSNVYLSSQLDPALKIYGEYYHVGACINEDAINADGWQTPFFSSTRQLIQQKDLELIIVCRELLYKTQAATLELGKDAYIWKTDASRDVFSRTIQLRLTVLMLGDISTGFYYDAMTDMIVTYLLPLRPN
jgi:hypothetical protein